jgi:hypothetical protein
LLYTTGQLDDDERTRVEQHWRMRFDDAQGPHFAYLASSGWLSGDAAREAHYRWAGIPQKLLRKWSAEQRRQHKPPPAARGAESLII